MTQDQKYVLRKVSDAEAVRHEKTGKFYIREAEEHHEMSGYFEIEEAAWMDARGWVDTYL
jgi:hypothetical protein